METWVPIMRSFHLTPGTVCVWVAEWITQDDELGFALDPHSCAGACSHLHAVLHSSLQTPDNHWTDGCIHRLIDMKPRFVGQTPDLTTTDMPDRIHWKVIQYITKAFRLASCIRCRVWFYLVLLDDAVLLVGGRRVPWHADGCAVMAPHCQHCHLLWRCTGRWRVKKVKILKKQGLRKKWNINWYNR